MEQRLIDANALVTDISFFDGDKYHYGYSQGMIESAPTIDAVPVVRCKECNHWTRNEDYSYVGRCELWNVDFENDFYCADGERRSE